MRFQLIPRIYIVRILNGLMVSFCIVHIFEGRCICLLGDLLKFEDLNSDFSLSLSLYFGYLWACRVGKSGKTFFLRVSRRVP